MGNDWCYEHFINGTEPVGLFPRLYYKIWLSVGVSLSGLMAYLLGHWLQRKKQDEEVTP